MRKSTFFSCFVSIWCLFLRPYVGLLLSLYFLAFLNAYGYYVRVVRRVTEGCASTSPQTSLAPAAKSKLAHASRVAPVVHTSSITRILRLRRSWVVIFS